MCSVEISALKPLWGPIEWGRELHCEYGGVLCILKACGASVVRLVWTGAPQSLPRRWQQHYRWPLSLNQMVGGLNVGGEEVRERGGIV